MYVFKIIMHANSAIHCSTCLVDVEGKKLPTELKAEASQLRKKMKFDDSEREGVYMYYFCACTRTVYELVPL